MMSALVSRPKWYKTVVEHVQGGSSQVDTEGKGSTLSSAYFMHSPSEGPELLHKQ